MMKANMIGCVVMVLLFLTGTASAVTLLPAGQQGIPQYAAVSSPVAGSDPMAMKPLGVGAVAGGGDTLGLHVGFDQFAGPVDIYLAVSSPALGPDLLLLTETNVHVYSASAPLPSLRSNTTGPVDISLFGDIPLNALPAGTYTIYVLVSPAGDLSRFYLWSTSFNVPRPFVLGQLPLPLPITGSPDEMTATLAKKILEGGDDALPALIAAILAAGFTIERDGVILHSPVGVSQGLAFQAWEIQAMDKLMRKGLVISLGAASANLASTTVKTTALPFEALIYEGIRAHAAGTNPAMRFWALFIHELGWQSTTPYSIMGDPTLSNANVNAVQMAFIFRRLSGDLAALYNANSPASPSTSLSGRKAAMDAQASSPCEMNGWRGEVLDWQAAMATSGFGASMEVLAGAGFTAAENIQTLTGIANMASAYVKLMLTWVAFSADMSMDPPGPLERTKSTTSPGEKKTLSVHVHLDKNDKDTQEWVNCIRPVINRIGLDFELADDGAAKNSEINWVITKGGTNTVGGVNWGIVQFVGGNPVGNNMTDASGIARMDIEGIKQSKEIKPSAQQVRKKAAVVAHVKLKPSDIYRDFKDANSNVGFGFDALGGALTMPAELMYRTNWMFAGAHKFDVLDWSEVVTGNILITQEGKSFASSPTSNFQVAYKDELQCQLTTGRFSPAYSYGEYTKEYAEISLRGYSERTAAVSYNYWLFENGQDGDYEGCNLMPGCPFHWERAESDRFTAKYYAFGDGTPSPIKIYPDGHYVISVNPYGWSVDMKGPYRYKAIRTSTVPGDPPVSTSENSGSTTKRTGPLKIEVTGYLDSNDPMRLIGQQTFQEPKWVDGEGSSMQLPTTITVDWDITLHCTGTDVMKCNE